MSRTYLMSEILENNGKNGKPVWIVVKGIVYDLTKFLKDHPGGDYIILEHAGKDATKAFNNVGHSVDAIQNLKLYKIGIITNECSPQCTTTTISPVETTNRTTMEKQNSRKEKKRLKLFFCF